MILILHIALALTSVIVASLAFLRPSRAKLTGSYALVAATLGSGTYLVISTHASLVSSCFSGLLYLSVVSAGIFAARRKLAYERVYSRTRRRNQ